MDVKMKKYQLLLFLTVLFTTAFFGMPVHSKAAVSENTNVAVNQENFPDERFRALAEYLDKDKNQILSETERNLLKELKVVYEGKHHFGQGVLAAAVTNQRISSHKISDDSKLVLQWGSPDVEGVRKLSVKGIEYFPELRSYSVVGYHETEGTLAGNGKLTDICLALSGEEIEMELSSGVAVPFTDCTEFERQFPLKQLKRIRIGVGFRFQKFSLAKAVRVEELEFGHNSIYGFGDDSNPRTHSEIGMLDLSGHKKLKKIAFYDVKTEVIDLRKNKELKEIMIGGHPLWQDVFNNNHSKKAGSGYTISNFTSKLKLPKNNKIQKLECTSALKKLDITSCRKLKFLRLQGNVLVRTKRSWYEKAGKKSLVLYVRGTQVKQKINKKTKKFVYIKTQKLTDRHLDLGQYTHG